MVAYESFDTGSGYKNEDQKTNFSSAVDKYNTIYDTYHQQMNNATKNYKGSIHSSELAELKGQKPLNYKLYKGDVDKLNKQNVGQLMKQLNTIKRIAKHNIINVNKDSSSLRASIEDEGVDGIGEDNTSDPKNWKQITGDKYGSSLDRARKEQHKILEKIDLHDGEYDDAKLQRKSYNLHSIVFSIIFIVVVGLIIRAALTDKSDVIETIILFLGIALALYYLIEYIF